MSIIYSSIQGRSNGALERYVRQNLKNKVHTFGLAYYLAKAVKGQTKHVVLGTLISWLACSFGVFISLLRLRGKKLVTKTTFQCTIR